MFSKIDESQKPTTEEYRRGYDRIDWKNARPAKPAPSEPTPATTSQKAPAWGCASGHCADANAWDKDRRSRFAEIAAKAGSAHGNRFLTLEETRFLIEEVERLYAEVDELSDRD